ncbi:MAG TPA: bifunctional nuclease family protein [Anaerolineaceae bacterium]|uniref:BFN domain-containing protein n=1 Tax=Anaerolinea thermophila TaxID=167964 RepID=A0A101FYR0_9CHLR|nr:MAG: hypothetical protein XD73_0253 [Anaerolinea thermophila]HAF62892.1 bifunctional nuclease family protein [Anaerolineaceae bacterium]
MAKLIEATIDSIRMSLTSQQRIIILKDVNQERYLPIWIGPYESESISIALQEIEISRPQTHDLVKNAIYELGGNINRIIINELKDDIFYGVIDITQGKKQISLDTRPSDALALAVRTHVPIFISEEIMESASIVPVEEEYISSRSEQGTTEMPSVESIPPMDMDETITDRLSVFEEFLQNLDEEQHTNEDDEYDDDETDDDETDDDDYPDDSISAV